MSADRVVKPPAPTASSENPCQVRERSACVTAHDVTGQKVRVWILISASDFWHGHFTAERDECHDGKPERSQSGGVVCRPQCE